jgi:hypothetical protein
VSLAHQLKGQALAQDNRTADAEASLRQAVEVLRYELCDDEAKHPTVRGKRLEGLISAQSALSDFLRDCGRLKESFAVTCATLALAGSFPY